MPALRTRDTPAQSLEVMTDTIQTPSLAIVSPTPRAISFPFNQSDACPYPSPISPFEPELRKFALSPTFVRTLSPLSPPDTCTTSSSSASIFSATTSTATSSISTFPATPSSPQKRRKSSICSDIERRPKRGDDDYIKRPENAFILFRRKCCEERQAAQEDAALDGPTKKQRQADLSKTISQQWKALSPEERLYWEEFAKVKKKEHEQMYPNYVYRPQRTKDRKGKKGKRGEEGDSETSISFVLPLCAPPVGKNHSRSSSAPTPPPRQTIQIPSVYMPSCPTSPSMVPMINRRASHPDHGSSSSSQFDFVASSTALPQQQYPSSDLFPGVNTGIYQGMQDNPHPLSISSDVSMNHTVHQMGSPTSSVSSGSGPSSPASSTFSPVNCMSMDLSYPLLPCDDGAPQMTAGSFCGGPMDNVQIGYSWDADGAWGTQGQMLAGDEFDMSAIPPVELGIPGCGDEVLTSASSGTFNMGYTPGHYDPMVIEASQYSGDSQNQDTFEQLFNFESMLATHHGY